MLVHIIISIRHSLDRLHYVNYGGLGSTNSNLYPISSLKRGLVLTIYITCLLKCHLTHVTLFRSSPTLPDAGESLNMLLAWHRGALPYFFMNIASTVSFLGHSSFHFYFSPLL